MAVDQEKHIDLLYRRMAGPEFGDLLEDMLFDLKFTSPCENDGDMALNNYAKRLLVKVYADEEGTVSSTPFFETVRRLIRRKKTGK